MERREEQMAEEERHTAEIKGLEFALGENGRDLRKLKEVLEKKLYPKH